MLQEGNAAGAIQILARATQGSKNQSNDLATTFRLQMLLGSAYAQMGQADQAALAYEQAAELEPENPAPTLAAAQAWSAAQRTDLAIQRCRYLRHPSHKVKVAVEPACKEVVRLNQVLGGLVGVYFAVSMVRQVHSCVFTRCACADAE